MEGRKTQQTFSDGAPTPRREVSESYVYLDAPYLIPVPSVSRPVPAPLSASAPTDLPKATVTTTACERFLSKPTRKSRENWRTCSPSPDWSSVQGCHFMAPWLVLMGGWEHSPASRGGSRCPSAKQ